LKPATCAGHWLLPLLLSGLCGTEAAQLLHESRKLYEDHARDAGDSMLMAMQAQNYTKVC